MEDNFPHFKQIEENLYTERKPVLLEDDEISVCYCYRIPGEEACGNNCVNRLTFIECTPGHCPCGKDCTNQAFQKRQYAKIKPFRTKDKGWGIMTLQDLKQGDFVIEYVGQVISNETCIRRLEKYRDTPHFYILTLNANECIDARKKGNFARFINHSCKPNCTTQKWNVLGETRIGIFALVDIKKGEELTFDYQFERFGSKKQPCYCKAENCRGFLGEKPTKLMKTAQKKDSERNSKKREGSKSKQNLQSRKTEDDWPQWNMFVKDEVHLSQAQSQKKRETPLCEVAAPFLLLNQLVPYIHRDQYSRPAEIPNSFSEHYRIPELKKTKNN